MGGYEASALAETEPSLKYHPNFTKILIPFRETGGETLPDGQFDWGGFLLKRNGGAQRFLQNGWQSFVECKGI